MCIFFNRLFLLQPNSMCDWVPDPSNLTYGGLCLHKKLLCEISRKAQKVRIIFSSRFFAEIWGSLTPKRSQGGGKQPEEGGQGPRQVLGCGEWEEEAGLTTGWAEMFFSFPAAGPGQLLSVIRSPSYIFLLPETTIASLLRNGVSCSEPS